MLAARYIRVSSAKQERKGFSLGDQKKLLTEAVKRNNFQSEDCDLFMDVQSGADDERPAYNKMMTRIMEGHYQALFVLDITRLTRTDSRAEEDRIIQVLNSFSCQLYTNSAQYDLSNPENRMHFGFTVVMARYDREKRRELSKQGRQSAREAGKNPGQPPSTGYVKYYQPDGSLIYKMDKQAIKPVKLAFEMALKGAGGTRIMKALNAKGYLSKTGNPYSPIQIYQWLSNPTYAGYVHIGMQRGTTEKRKGMWPAKFIDKPLISLEDWETVQALLNSRKTGKSPVRFPLSGILLCPSCQAPMIGTYKRAGTDKVRYYNCQPQTGTVNTCPNTEGRSIKMQIAHSLLIEAMPEIIKQIETKLEKKPLKGSTPLQVGTPDTEEEDYKTQLASIERKIVNNLRDQEESPSDYRRIRIAELEQEAKTIKSRMQTATVKAITPAFNTIIELAKLLTVVSPNDMEIISEVSQALFTKVHYSRKGTHRKYQFKLDKVELKTGETITLRRKYIYTQ
jgi:DNA invertase Pin-like site-specific DNA recombinase